MLTCASWCDSAWICQLCNLAKEDQQAVKCEPNLDLDRGKAEACTNHILAHRLFGPAQPAPWAGPILAKVGTRPHLNIGREYRLAQARAASQ